MLNVGYSHYYLPNHSTWDDAQPCGTPSLPFTLNAFTHTRLRPQRTSYAVHVLVYPRTSMYTFSSISTIHIHPKHTVHVHVRMYVYSRPAWGCVSEWKEHAERVGVTTIIICPIHKGYYEYLHVFERGSLWREWRLYSGARDGGL